MCRCPARISRRRKGIGLLARIEYEPVCDFDAFFRSQFAVMSGAAALMVRDFDAGRDLAQEALVRVYQRWGRVASCDHARNLAYRTLTNLVRSRLRKERRLTLVGLRPADDLVRVRQDDSEAVDMRLTLKTALQGLSARQRTCLVLTDYVGLDVGTVARLIRARPSTVSVHLSRARRRIRERSNLANDALGGG